MKQTLHIIWKVILIVLGIIIYSQKSAAQADDSLYFKMSSDSSEWFDVSKYVTAFEDSSQMFHIEQVSSPAFSDHFRENKFDLKRKKKFHVRWARFYMINSTGMKKRIMFASYGDTVKCYRKLNSAQFDIQITGTMVPISMKQNRFGIQYELEKK